MKSLRKMPVPRLSGRGGFTLIELLCVVLIIAILAAFAFRGYQRTLANAKVAGTVSQLRQIGVALSLYATENNDRYPVVWNSDKNLIWADYLLEFMGAKSLAEKRGVFVDPSNAIPCPIYNGLTKTTFSANDVIFGYDPTDSGNASKAAGLPRSALARPGQLILVATGCQNPSNHGGANASFWNPWQMTWPLADKSQVVPYSASKDVDTGAAPGYLRYRIKGGIGALMGDGSVRIIPKNELTIGNLNPY